MDIEPVSKFSTWFHELFCKKICLHYYFCSVNYKVQQSKGTVGALEWVEREKKVAGKQQNTISSKFIRSPALGSL